MKKRKEKMGIIWDLQRIRKVFPFICLSPLKRASHFQGGARRAQPSDCNNFNVTCYRRLPPTTSFGFKLDRWLVCSPRCRVGDANADLHIASRHQAAAVVVEGGGGSGGLLAHRSQYGITFHLHSNFVQICCLFNGP